MSAGGGVPDGAGSASGPGAAAGGATPAAARDAADAVRICAAHELLDGGSGRRVAARFAGEDAVVFFVRHGGRAYGYVNRCAHVPMELDWVEGQFFESSGRFLMCATHGAIYEPDSGRCVGGPCRGGRLRALQVEERDAPDGRAVFWLPDGQVRPAPAA